MLKNLVKKFKSHSLNDEETEAGPEDTHRADAQQRHNHHLRKSSGLVRRSCCQHKQAVCPHHLRCQYQRGQGPRSTGATGDKGEFYDSGTESDEELEFIETNSTHSVPVSQTSDYYASQQSLSINSCRSSHCGSPLLALSDQECNSWESVGSESGINLRASANRRQQQPYFNASGMANLNYEFLLSPKKIRNNATQPITTPSMIKEELPNHHYHTRQQFQRLKQQISMTDGECVDSQFDQDQGKGASSTIDASGNEIWTKIDTRTTAFTPVSRFSTSITTGALEKSPNSGSSVDELEEINSNDGSVIFRRPCVIQSDHNCASRRYRSSTMSTMSSSGVSTWSSGSETSSISDSGGRGSGWSEKRKWSQVRQQQKSQCSQDCCCSCRECGNGEVQFRQQQQPEQRTLLHAARKTPVKLLYPLASGGPGQESKSFAMTTGVIGERKMDVDQSTRKTRLSSRKKCRGEDDERLLDGNRGVREALVKRPSLDFDKMRAKRVHETESKPRRSSSLSVVSKSKLKEYHQNAYHLRTRRQRCLFRPLEPPVTQPMGVVPYSTTDDWHSIYCSGPNLFSLHKAMESVVRFD